MSLEALHIPEAKDAPEVLLDISRPMLRISGKSFPEHSERFYRPIMEWLDKLLECEKPGTPIPFEIYLFYINSSSVFALLEMLHKVKSLNDSGFQLQVQWQYDEDDDDIRRIGEDFSRITAMPFEFEAVPEDDF